jgi:hypothetical protein
LARLSSDACAFSGPPSNVGGAARGQHDGTRDAKETDMPRMIVTTETLDRSGREVLMDEQVATSDLASDHFAAQLVERIGWALSDAETVEHRTLHTANGAMR